MSSLGKIQALALLRRTYRGAPAATRAHVLGRFLSCPFLRVLAHLPPGASLLDLGAGHGIFAHLALAAGARSARRRRAGPPQGLPHRRRPRLRVVDGYPAAVRGRFEAVTIFDVLYRLPRAGVGPAARLGPRAARPGRGLPAQGDRSRAPGEGALEPRPGARRGPPRPDPGRGVQLRDAGGDRRPLRARRLRGVRGGGDRRRLPPRPRPLYRAGLRYHPPPQDLVTMDQKGTPPVQNLSGRLSLAGRRAARRVSSSAAALPPVCKRRAPSPSSYLRPVVLARRRQGAGLDGRRRRPQRLGPAGGRKASRCSSPSPRRSRCGW